MSLFTPSYHLQNGHTEKLILYKYDGNLWWLSYCNILLIYYNLPWIKDVRQRNTVCPWSDHVTSIFGSFLWKFTMNRLSIWPIDGTKILFLEFLEVSLGSPTLWETSPISSYTITFLLARDSWHFENLQLSSSYSLLQMWLELDAGLLYLQGWK